MARTAKRDPGTSGVSARSGAAPEGAQSNNPNPSTPKVGVATDAKCAQGGPTVTIINLTGRRLAIAREDTDGGAVFTVSESSAPRCARCGELATCAGSKSIGVRAGGCDRCCDHAKGCERAVFAAEAYYVQRQSVAPGHTPVLKAALARAPAHLDQEREARAAAEQLAQWLTEALHAKEAALCGLEQRCLTLEKARHEAQKRAASEAA
jgi:hypothetical protein